VRFTLVGQSFIYHQIRKMVGMLIKICHEDLPGVETLKTAFKKDKFDAYLAPGEGLYLNRMTFDLYNKRKEVPLRVELNEQDEVRIEEFRKYLEGVILTH
jgi:tRNA pseudouridine38-40 synthase